MATERKQAAGAAVAKAMSFLPVTFLRHIELAAQLGQGKSWGTATVTSEVAAVLSLLPPDRLVGLHAADVGANVGDWSAALIDACPSAEVEAFEPSSTAFGRLEQRLGGRRNVELVRSAVGQESGTATLWSDAPGSVLGSLERRRLDHHRLDFSHAEEVPVVSLDDFYRGRPSSPVVLKMDVEGRELDVLRGAEQTLKSVQVIQFEFGGCNIDSRTYFQDFWYLFKDIGFDLYRLGPRGLRRMVSYSEADECFLTTNFIASR